ncbi:class I SAM-dependent methyltransferase [Actinomadura barringtoniae]|uniref:Class I SAM-dependent methyltransferase n=1 Tax=Actinomadura barringtoniae TaxID=1427535 RepID=A0A939PN08_9ACTN|nr:class I SAM-dependent methyltransferase [Actinomadura barringtoniae]MBO2455342.1 class I SAM-dependent methyltransferase [Actinomadura barringtoniae]
MVDPVERHIEQALARCDCTAELGDARTLTAADRSYDAVLLLGPLYHLPERSERVQALREARRVLRPGGPVAAAAISRHAAVLDLAAVDRLAPESRMRETLATGRHDRAIGFTTAYFHTAEELASELAEAGFEDVRLNGIEGPTWTVLKGVEAHTGESLAASGLLDSAIRAARLTDGDPALVAASSHLLAVGHA